MICFAPILMTGALLTLYPNASHESSFTGGYAEVQTCPTGFGAHALGLTAGLFTGGIHYGVSWALPGGVTATIQPVLGVSYTPRNVRELPSEIQFETGLNLMASYDRYTVGAKWLHASNAGTKSPNIGIDLLGLFVGVTL